MPETIEPRVPQRADQKDIIIAGKLGEIKQSTDNVKSSIDQLIPAISLLIESNKPKDGQRGARFIGSFKSVSKLPYIDGVDVLQGDFAYVEDAGELWYA